MLIFCAFFVVCLYATNALADIRADVRELFDRDMDTPDFAHIQSLGLQRTYENAQGQGGGAPVNFMVCENPSAAFARSPSYLGGE